MDALIADRDSFNGHRQRQHQPVGVLLARDDPGKYFNDIAGNGSSAGRDDGLFPTTPGYDEATGIGSPKFAAVITGF